MDIRVAVSRRRVGPVGAGLPSSKQSRDKPVCWAPCWAPCMHLKCDLQDGVSWVSICTRKPLAGAPCSQVSATAFVLALTAETARPGMPRLNSRHVVLFGSICLLSLQGAVAVYIRAETGSRHSRFGGQADSRPPLWGCCSRVLVATAVWATAASSGVPAPRSPGLS